MNRFDALKRWTWSVFVICLVAFSFAGCDGDDGAQGPQGPAGPEGPPGAEGPPGSAAPPPAQAAFESCGVCHSANSIASAAVAHELPPIESVSNVAFAVNGADLDVTLDEPALRARGSFLGAGGVMVFDDSRDMVAVARQAMEFFAHESCGKCFPCRIGTQRLSERLAGSAGPRDPALWKAEVREIGRTMAAVSACGLGIAAPSITESLLSRFEDQVDKHLEGRTR